MGPAKRGRPRAAVRAGAGLLCVLVWASAGAAQQPAPDPADQPPAAQANAGGEKVTGVEKNPSGEGATSQEKGPPALPPAAPEGAEAQAKETWYSAHAQATVVSQGNWKFRSPYEGPLSLLPILSYRTTATATLFLDARLWRGGEVVFNPEMAGGTGLSGTDGLAGFPNGEATRVGTIEPTPYIARFFLRQTFGLDGDQEKVEDAPNQIAGLRDVDRLTVSIGKFSAEDFFDDNRFSHDPRTQFLNWSLMYTGAWDYPANVRGYTYGMVIDFNSRFLAARYGVVAEPSVANGAPIDPHLLKANGHILEFEQRYNLEDHPGHLREWAYLNHAHMGKYREALAEMPVDPDVTQTRAYRIKYGFGLSWDQELTRDLGVFVRAGWNDGQSESWAFTEIDETLALGLLLQGRAWRRPQDAVGLAAVCNGLSSAHRDYLAAGGLGFIIGDGRLHYGAEEILEAFYNWEVRKYINVTADFQGVNNPAYNKDRGPVAILAIRFHLAY
jgi:high affinity Mn2+ porin